MQNQQSSSTLAAEYRQALSLFQAGQYESALDHIWQCIYAKPLAYRYQQVFCRIAAPILEEYYLTCGERLKAEGHFTELVRLYDNAMKLRLDPQIFKIARREAKHSERKFNHEYQLAQELLHQEKYMKFQRQVDKLLEMAPQNQKVQALFSHLQYLKDINLLNSAPASTPTPTPIPTPASVLTTIPAHIHTHTHATVPVPMPIPTLAPIPAPVPAEAASIQRTPNIEIPPLVEANVAKTKAAPGDEVKVAPGGKNKPKIPEPVDLNLERSIQLLEDLELP